MASAAPGTAVAYTITVADTGQTPYTGATVTDDLTGVLGAAAYNGDAAATIGTVVLRQPRPHLDRRPRTGRHRHHHLLGHRQQPRDRRHQPGQHRDLGRAGQQLPAGNQQRPQCTVTTGVISGPLTMTAPASAALGDGQPGATIASSLGTVQVTDGRGFGADWTASVSSSNFTTGRRQPRPRPSRPATPSTTSPASPPPPAPPPSATPRK